MARYLTWPLLVGVGLLSSGCLVTPERLETLQQNVRRLQGDVSALAKKQNTNEERLRRVEGQSMGIEGSASQVTDVVARLEEMAVETRMIQGKLEETSYHLSELSQRLDETEKRVARLPGETRSPDENSTGRQPPVPGAVPPPPIPRGALQAPSPGGTTRPGVSPLQPSVPGQPLPPPGGGLSTARPPAAPAPPVMQGSLPSPEEVYRNALTDYTKGNYELAIEGFKNYLTFFPKTSLVPNAQYWLGESYYSKGEYLTAIREFDKLIKGYPGSTKMPSAMLKKGYSYVELGETALGQGVLRELVAKFPRSREARLAQESLERLE